jgi:hypothetical protein
LCTHGVYGWHVLVCVLWAAYAPIVFTCVCRPIAAVRAVLAMYEDKG